MGTIYKRYHRKNGVTLDTFVYQGTYVDRNKVRQQVSLKTSDRLVAKARLRDLELHSTDQAEDASEVLGAALNYFIDIACAPKPIATRKSYEQKSAHLGRLMGGVDLAVLSIEHTERYVATRLAEGAHSHSVHKEMIVLRGALKSARQRKVWRGSLEDTVPKVKANYVPRETYLTWTQFDAMAQHLVPELPNNSKLDTVLNSEVLRTERAFFCLVIAFTSARLGELYKLRWSDVDRNRATIKIPKGKTKGRTMQIATLLWPWLLAFGERAGWTGPIVREWGNVRRDLALACKRAKVPKVTPNDLRRTFASWLKQNDVDSAAVAQLMGHSSTRMVDLVYGKLDGATLARAIGRLPGGVVQRCAGVTHDEASDGEHGTHGTIAKTAAAANSLVELATTAVLTVPGDGVEPPTHGFSVRCSTS